MHDTIKNPRHNTTQDAFGGQASGATGCTLFTDLANPVSNRIYERIGYRRVGTCVTVAW